LTPTISLKTFYQNFEIAILFSAADFQIKIMFLRRKLPTALRTRAVSYALGTYKVLIESVIVETSKKAHLIGNSKG
jgi:hypothetical protein